jgi:hypothetical protein
MAAARTFVVTYVAAAVAAALLALAGAAGAAPERTGAIGLTGPTRIVQGASVTMFATVRSGARCTLTLRYKRGSQRVGPVTSAANKAVFTFDVAQRAAPGRATATVRCGAAGSATRRIVVIGGVVAPKINVVKHGFSLRVNRFGGSTVSWGAILANTAPRTDAVDAMVLANFVLPDNTLIGSMTRRLSRIDAGAQAVVGGDLNFRGVPPIVRVEIVVQVAKGEAPKKGKPLVSNEHVVPDLLDPAYVGSVEGELANDDLGRRMRSAELYTVALDAGGNVLGGGVGNAIATLPPGAREFFKITGLRGVPMGSVASLIVYVVPSYEG